ncbi:hypothetical protein LJK87_08365 [Paenibacillus sp. P25]|nr:hypothetical protein LJK87_08365 [Paenibacillus sp. P25]
MTIDGMPADNGKEPFPLLVFRDVTYFPMTWDFTVGKFGWKTAWDDRFGYSIYTGLVLDRIIYDDEAFLYAEGFSNGEYGIVRFRKDFEGKAEVFTPEQSSKLREVAAAYGEEPVPETRDTVIQGDSVYYKGTELVNAAAHRAEHPELYNAVKPADGAVIEYNEKTITSPAGLTVVNLAFRTAKANVANDPDTHTYLIKAGKAAELAPFNKTIRSYRLSAGGMWLWSSATTSTSARSSGIYGLVLWVDNNGSARLWNNTLQSGQSRVLRADPEELMVQAYPGGAESGGGHSSGSGPSRGAYYILRSDGSFTKIADADAGAFGYVDRQGVWYELPGADQVTNLSKGISRRFEP